MLKNVKREVIINEKSSEIVQSKASRSEAFSFIAQKFVCTLWYIIFNINITEKNLRLIKLCEN